MLSKDHPVQGALELHWMLISLSVVECPVILMK